MDPQLAEDVRVLNAVRSRKRARIYIKRARYARVNRRRADLIHLVVRNHLPDDDPEYVALQACVGRLVNLAHPRPRPSTEQRERVRQLYEQFGPKVDESGVVTDPGDPDVVQLWESMNDASRDGRS